MYASELMDDDYVSVHPDDPVADVARLLYERDLDGVCVVAGEELIGIVTVMDIIFQERNVEVPHYVSILSKLVPLEPERQRALDKATGTTVRDIMTARAIGVPYDAKLSDVATLMVDHHITVVPVIKDGRVAGVIDKKQVLREALTHLWKTQEG